MNRCPLSYAELDGQGSYKAAGLRRLSPNLKSLSPLPFSSASLVEEAAARASKMSIGGVQPKLSAILRVSEGMFDLVDQGGRFILKPESPQYPEVPANEDLTMRLAARAGLDVPAHGLVWTETGDLCYVIRRFDRMGQSRRLHVEDFAQLIGENRETKYESSIEQVAAAIERFCTFPRVEHIVLLRMVLVSFLTGNEDMHLKNFSLIVDERGLVKLTPVYDMVNSTIVLRNPQEESALPLQGKKSGFMRKHFVDYLAGERLGLPSPIVVRVLSELESALPDWLALIEASFLSDKKKEAYREVVRERSERLGLGRVVC
ncbi:HipA domain-containing protein [Rhodothermus sp. AH-315-K08]|nr:HipA domain-containing protein [Rhodothermus sp. AH-315-K08]